MEGSGRKSSAGYAGLVTTGMSFVNVGIGFVFQALIAARIGISELSDAFQLTWSIVTFSSVTLFSLVLTLLVPRFQIGVRNAVHFGDGLPPAVLGAMFAGAQAFMSQFLGPGDLRTMLLYSSPAAFFAGLACAPQAAAYVQKRFLLAALGGVANGIGLVLATVVAGGQPSATSLGVSLTVGYLVQAVAVTVPFWWNRPALEFSRSIPLPVFAGVTAYTLLSKLQPVAERLMATDSASGAATGLGLGQKIAQGILMVASFGLAITSTATLARLVHQKELQKAGALLARILVGTGWLALVGCALSMPLAWPMTVLLFGRGEFGRDDSAYVADTVLLLLPWMFANAVAGALTAYLYVQRSYMRAVGAASVGLATTVAVGFSIRSTTPEFSVAIASSAGALASLIWVAVLVARAPVADELMAGLRHYSLLVEVAVVACVASAVSYGVVRHVTGQGDIFTIVVPLVATIIVLVVGAMSARVRDQASEVARGAI